MLHHIPLFENNWLMLSKYELTFDITRDDIVGNSGSFANTILKIIIGNIALVHIRITNENILRRSDLSRAA